MNKLEIHNLSKTYGSKRILKNVDLVCNTGELIGLFGKNGSGKSTLLRAIYGEVKAASVDIKINNYSIKSRDIITSKKIGYLPQDFFLPKDTKVRDIIPLVIENPETQDKIFYSPQVSTFDNIKIGRLSYGQRRYLEILLIINLKHAFLLLDEPFSMLEPFYKNSILELLSEIKKIKGIIITDHYYEDVLEVSDRTYVIHDKVLKEIKEKKDLKHYGYLKI